MRARGRAVVLLGALAALLASCASVPTSGPIRQGPVVDSAESTQFIRVIAAPPSVGADPAEIVRGFLESHASLEEDHAIARRYLTEEAAAQWDPDASTTVYAPTSLALSARGGRVRADLAVVGRVLADGTLETVVPAVTRDVTFTLEQVLDGGAPVPQWRISDPPEGTMISSADLRRAFRLYQAYFPSRRSEVLVPDGRLLPFVGPSLPTTLAESVLAGPAQWLGPGVRSGAPPGTELALGAVPVSGGVAAVELTDHVLMATDAERRDLAAQLTWTLTQLPEVTGVRLQVGGEPLDIPGAPVVMDRAVYQSRAPDALSIGPAGDERPAPYLLDGRTVVRVAESGRTAIAIPDGPSDALAGLAVALDEQLAAVADPVARGLWLIPLDATTEARRIAATQVASIGFDVDGQAWFVDGGLVRRTGPDGESGAVPVRAEGMGRVTALALARDGARVALLVDGAVHLGVVALGSEGGLEIGSVRRVDTTVEEAIDLAWRDATTVDVLGRVGDGARQVLTLSIGSGQALPIGAPARPRELAAAPGSVSLVAGAQGVVFGNVGLQWRERGDGTSVAYPG